VSNEVRPTVRAPEGRGHGADRIGTVVCATLLALAHLVTGYVVLVAFTAEPGTTETAVHSGVASGLALVFTVVTAPLTLLFVKAGWLRAWWYLLPEVRVALMVPQTRSVC
jgi:hypothetical protein